MQSTVAHVVLDSEVIDTAALRPEDITGSVKRVAIFTEAFLPKVDGVSRTALLTIKYLQKTGREILVFAPAPTLPMVGSTPVCGIPSLWLPFYPENPVAPPWPFVLPHLRRFQPDLIHLFSPFSLGTMGMIAGDWLKIPVIANYQTDLPAYTRTYGFSLLWSTFVGLLRYTHNGCSLTLAPSRATLNELRRWGFHRVRLWERGVDAQRFNPARRSASGRARLLAGRDPSQLIALYVGRMAKDKHLETLFPLACEPGVALTLVGGGHDLLDLKRTFAATNAHFTGYLYGDALAEAFASADLFVFPGPEETFGQVVLEAMASGLPAIVTSRGGPATIVCDGSSGYICSVDDSAAFVDRVRRLRDDPDARRRMGEEARSIAEHRPWLAIMRQLEQHYAEALDLHARLARWQRAIR